MQIQDAQCTRKTKQLTPAKESYSARQLKPKKMGPKSKMLKKNPFDANIEQEVPIEEVAIKKVGAEGALKPNAKFYDREGRTTELCPKCKKHLRPNMGRANDQRTPLQIHMSRCYLCKYCHTYRSQHSGHEKNCNLVCYEAKLKAGKGLRRCPICGLPYPNCVLHMHQGHHLAYDDIARYRLIAQKSTANLTKKEARDLHVQAQQQVDIIVIFTCAIIKKPL